LAVYKQLIAKHFRKTIVLGAEIMGVAIVAHLTNTDVPVPLFDPPTQEGETNGFVQQALDRMKPLARDLFRVVRSDGLSDGLIRNLIGCRSPIYPHSMV